MEGRRVEVKGTAVVRDRGRELVWTRRESAIARKGRPSGRGCGVASQNEQGGEGD